MLLTPSNTKRSDKEEGRKKEGDKPRSDKSDKPRSDKSDKPRSDKSDKPRSDKSDKPRSDKADKPRSDKADKPRSDKADKPRSDKADKPRSDKADKPLLESQQTSNNPASKLEEVNYDKTKSKDVETTENDLIRVPTINDDNDDDNNDDNGDDDEELTHGVVFIYESNGIYYSDLNNIDKADGKTVIIHPVYHDGYYENLESEEVFYDAETGKYISGSTDGSWLDLIYGMPEVVFPIDLNTATLYEGVYYHCDGCLINRLTNNMVETVNIL
jgi:hypothetical protein